MSVESSVIGGDTLDPVVVNVGIDHRDIKGIVAQFHLCPDDISRAKYIVPVQQIVKLNATIAMDERARPPGTGKSSNTKGIIIANTSMGTLPRGEHSFFPCRSRGARECRMILLIIDLV